MGISTSYDICEGARKGEIMGKFYQASNDSMFKAIFCNEKNKDLLERLIESSINEKVKVDKPTMQEIVKTNIYVKNKTLYIITESLDKKQKYNIELNVNYYDGLNNRNAAYIFSKYSEDVKVADDYSNMNKFIQINLTSGLPKDRNVINEYKLIDTSTDNFFIDNLIIYEINLDKIKETCYNDSRYKLFTALCCDRDELHKLCKGDKVLEKLESEVIRLNKDPKFIEFLSAEEDARKTHNTLMKNAKEEGLAEGYAGGSKETKIEIAKNMLNKNMDIETISEVTCLTKEEIETLK